jgi:hypothetical protein
MSYINTQAGYEASPHLHRHIKFMFNQLRVHYPQGSLISELLAIEHGKYVVRALVQNDGATLATGLAAADTVEQAEDIARSRALAVLGIQPTTDTPKTAATTVAPTPPPVTTFPAVNQRQIPAPSPIEEPTVGNGEMAVPSPKASRQAPLEKNFTTPSVEEEIPFSEDFSAAEVERFEEDNLVEPTLEPLETLPHPQPTVSPVPSYSFSEVQPEATKISTPSTPIDFSDIMAKTNVELKRLGWTTEQGRKYLMETYGKRSRQRLTDEELIDFLHHLELEPSPEE